MKQCQLGWNIALSLFAPPFDGAKMLESLSRVLGKTDFVQNCYNC